MKDWRIYNEDYFRKIKLYRIKFPEYWDRSYAQKNRFYKYVFDDACCFIRQFPKHSEYLERKDMCNLWHRHCDLCTQTITTHENIECYCTDDFFSWICKDCFDDFNEYFNWKYNEIED